MNRTQRLVLAALFTALSFIFTFFVKIPFPSGGYFNIGDAFIILSAIVIDPFTGVLVGALAGSLSDLFAGYALYIPFTIIAKALEALLAGLIYHKLKGIFKYIGIFAGAILMVATYALAYFLLLGKNAMWANLPFDGIQAVIAVTLSIILVIIFERTPLLRRIRPRK